MSRIGDKPIDMPNGVKVGVADNTVTVEGPLGKLDWTFRSEINVKVDDEAKQIVCSRVDDERQSRALHGLSRSTDPKHGRGRNRRVRKATGTGGCGLHRHCSK